MVPVVRHHLTVGEEPRAAVVAHLDTPSGPLAVANTHLTWIPGSGVRQLQEVTRALGEVPDPLLLVGDFNSFDVNDGYVDVMGITTGNPAAETAVIHWEDSPLSTANGGTPLILGNELIDDPEERYSYIFNNIKQSLDHAVINQALLYDPSVSDIVVDHARDATGDRRPTRPSRLRG